MFCAAHCTRLALPFGFVRLLVAAVAVLLGSAPLASAAGEPSTFAAARLGSLTVTSSVLVSPTAVEMRGVWQDTKRPCTATRRLSVRAQVDRVDAAGKTHRLIFTRGFKDANCAEGGPNVGFSLTAKMLVSACPDKQWKPGIYTFVTTTTEPVRKLKAIASLSWQKSGPC
jgi:hypothetical protein